MFQSFKHIPVKNVIFLHQLENQERQVLQSLQ